jgi:FHA domain
MDVTPPREDLLRRRLVAPLGAGKARSEHPDPELVAAHACGELSPEYGLAITRHLTICDDGRCLAVVRDAVAGASVARASLYARPDDGEPDEEAPVAGVEGVEGDAPAAPGPAARARTFECPDELWEAFASLAADQGRPVDAILEEAMEAFARNRPGRHASGLTMPRDIAVTEAAHTFPRERNTPTMPRAYLPRAPASSRRATPHPTSGHLSVVIEGVRYDVTKERVVVGRGGRASDLAIDDPGVSRQHALIERAGGAYYLVDMGSTNGVEYEGERIARKEIAHGDRFRIGDHELEFLFG